MDTINNEQLVLEELRRDYERKFSASDVIDGKLQNMFNFLTAVVALAPTLELMGNSNPGKTGLAFVFLLIVIFRLYYVAFKKIVQYVTPVFYRQPISVNKQELAKEYFHSTEKAVLLRTINEYLISLNEAGDKNLKKINTIREVSKLMVWIIALLFMAVPINSLLTSPTIADTIQFILQLIKAKP